jgi:ABC-type antimicrobial peptide transport system permease subunit
MYIVNCLFVNSQLLDKMKKDLTPPQLPLRFFRWYCHPKLVRHIEGDLVELYRERVEEIGKRNADIKFILDVLLLFRPGIVRSPMINYSLSNYAMFKSYFKIAWRNLLSNKGYAAINIGGLALGMSVALLIGLWIYDELSFNKYHKNYDRIARVLFHGTDRGEMWTATRTPIPLAAELRNSFNHDFERVVTSTYLQDHIISLEDKSFSQQGLFMDSGAPEMLTLEMASGTRSGLNELNSILLSASSAVALFGDDDPINKMVRIDNAMDVKVTGVYKDIPGNSEFHEVKFIAPWELYVAYNKSWIEPAVTSWAGGLVQVLVQLPMQTQIERVSEKIKTIIHDHESDENKIFNKQAFLFPMSKWHLYEEFKNGRNVGGRIQFVWLFGTIGVFVLLLACINFMNLSTARSEKRAKEVGIRKSMGSLRGQLINQFFSESILIAVLAFLLSIVVMILALPRFNEISNKHMELPFDNHLFWVSCITFTWLTGTIAGSYPALYLSSFQAVQVLKGTFRAARFASVPRQVLVVLQFTVSVSLIIGTIVVYKQIQYTKNRPVGYDRSQLIYLNSTTPDIHNHFDVIRNNLISSGAIMEMTESNSATTADYIANSNGLVWRGKDPELREAFGVSWVGPEYGKTVGWQILQGRDFSRDIRSDQDGMIINESAAKYMNLENPVGEIVMLGERSFTILGVVKDMVVGSPYEPSRKAIYMPLRWPNVVTVRLNPAKSTQEALTQVELTFKEFAPALPFDYTFTDEQYARKFNTEVRVGKLAAVFTTLAILISCLGLFGLASFVAEQRTKEIGIRKIVGASVFSLWKLLSWDFVILIAIACVIALPMAYYFMDNWLQTYHYHTDISLWIFVAATMGSLGITLITVSYQSISAALANPVKSLHSE